MHTSRPPFLTFERFLVDGKRFFDLIVPHTDDWDIYEACAVSVKEQKELGASEEGNVLTYGELNFSSLAKIIYHIKIELNAMKGGIVSKYKYTTNVKSRL